MPGEYLLSARATDAEGRTQPLEPPWNRGGFANNLVQRVPVLCVEARTAAPGADTHPGATRADSGR